ncbi:RecB family exonuclease [Lentzea flava]|uniref:PD-(D/E)XK endonuclease-like domain-containing protein n=1 Tax=Lentzea flava TaxID=103732 RepID=A0ABQ2UPT4_9PSEU|nr:PD-(D/E)XK nuclease family protein [Lentzea flava]GGU45722.1 hypothetical protein GCM10010178_42710 [Lentzea flava]
MQKRSVSQIKEYRACPARYFLCRIEKVWQRPAAWLSQGTAVHAAAEAWEKSGRTMSLAAVQEVFRRVYAEGINAMAGETPNWNFWFASGPYRGAVDVERRYGLGLDQADRYLRYYTERAPREVIWIAPDGTPAVELGFEIWLGSVPVRGYLDQAVIDPREGLIVRDIKSGNSPGDAFQLAVYAEAIRQVYGQEVHKGDYWMGKSGKPTLFYDLTEWPATRLVEEFEEVDELIKAEKFDPTPDEKTCMFCPVRTSCPIFQA